jgi:hypothetical protein
MTIFQAGESVCLCMFGIAAMTIAFFVLLWGKRER